MCTIMCYTGTDMKHEKFAEALQRTESRGPDMTEILTLPSGILGFQRLAIMDLSYSGMQPFTRKMDASICNGEIYGFRELKKELIEKGHNFISDSDCEVLIPMYYEYGLDMFAKLDAEFATVIYDGEKDSFIAARDPFGIRPLFYGYSECGKIMFASEAKNLVGLTDKIMPFPSGHYYADGKFTCYCDIAATEGEYFKDDLEVICKNIHDKLVAAIEKRMDADAPVGFLLSGGLDSSLVCSVAQKLYPGKQIKTFCIGMTEDAIDLKYAKEVADYIGSDHTAVYMTKEDVLESLDEVIKLLGTYDITTIRASMGMYLLCKKIHEISDVKVLLTGEISDELFGYKYTDFAPNAEEFQKESQKRVRELYMYDVLRADRCISSNSLEARVPFGDLDFVKYVMAIDPEKKLNKYSMGKYLLRHAFEGDYLPNSILYRDKAAFSDAVGHSMVDYLKEYAEKCYSNEEFEKLCEKYAYHAKPFTKESLLYREIFEKYYPGQSEMIVDYWMPNKEWEGCNVNDPSARVLSNYGNSGK
ncbi:asparagine synthase B [Clostridium uliginosum]|uniref:asparagine synthase (glutamine-hydrolyzing) n=1 Tax=Clostridium uliginosum TaxID=119641 RepID=A0A1I1S5I2_9CLOT|nr:asparagine synthase B [Clostridium uliginosum]SFD41637.1 asparagine synthase (glutamine-hydrolysing) [Clostridium uliginosum]